jgi:hypothetical protein
MSLLLQNALTTNNQQYLVKVAWATVYRKTVVLLVWLKLTEWQWAHVVVCSNCTYFLQRKEEENS